ncbi:MAG: hypothetical protein JMDDDDMK_04426 [Acidobacteria bacterium]|nr:hypothetical protein [Acidobacteriota bacterium]
MRSVKISELKNNLDKYLNEVSEGEELIIHNRNKPIAKLVPLQSADDEEARMESLVVAGKIRRPQRDTLPDSFWEEDGPKIPLKKIVAAVIADRDEG